MYTLIKIDEINNLGAIRIRIRSLLASMNKRIAQKEAENYLFMYEQTGKILNEITNNKLKLDARKKHITDVGVKLSFLKTEKDYLINYDEVIEWLKSRDKRGE